MEIYVHCLLLLKALGIFSTFLPTVLFLYIITFIATVTICCLHFQVVMLVLDFMCLDWISPSTVEELLRSCFGMPCLVLRHCL